MKSADLAKLGLPRADLYVKLPTEWKATEFSEINTPNGPSPLIRFERPNEPAIHLFGNQVDLRADGWYAKREHIEKQADRARKFEK